MKKYIVPNFRNQFIYSTLIKVGQQRNEQKDYTSPKIKTSSQVVIKVQDRKDIEKVFFLFTRKVPTLL